MNEVSVKMNQNRNLRQLCQFKMRYRKTNWKFEKKMKNTNFFSSVFFGRVFSGWFFVPNPDYESSELNTHSTKLL